MNNPADVSVVVGVDGSLESRAAVDLAGWEAYRRRRPLRLVHGYQPAAGDGPPVVEVSDLGQRVRDRLDGESDRICRRYPELRTVTTATAGDPGTVLVDQSATAALVVVGSRGLGSFYSGLPGSVAIRVATHSKAPAIVVRRPALRSRFGVVVGVDGSPGTAAAVEFAFDAAAARGTDLTAVCAWTPGSDRRADLRHEADRMLAEAVAGWQDKYPQVELIRRAVADHNPVRALLEAVAHAELAVVGSSRAGEVAGATVTGLIHHAETSVAIVPAETYR